jgi:hypothetical protein
MATENRLPVVGADEGDWGANLNSFLGKEHYDNTGVNDPLNGMHRRVTIVAGTATGGTAPLKFNSGTLLTTPEAGAVEFNSNTLYYTKTTGPTRLKIAAYDNTGGATGDMYYRNASGDLERIALGTDTHVLTLTSGVPGWAAPGGGGGGLTHPQVMARVSMGF